MITRNLLTRSYKLLLTLLVLLMSTNAFAQRLTATGKVTDAAGLEVIGASVLEKGTANGVVTNLDGEFSLSVGQNATLVISFIGYKTIEVKATTNMNITLQEDNELLDEVVVIGYGSVKRKDVTTDGFYKGFGPTPHCIGSPSPARQSSRRVGYATQR